MARILNDRQEKQLADWPREMRPVAEAAQAGGRLILRMVNGNLEHALLVLELLASDFTNHVSDPRKREAVALQFIRDYAARQNLVKPPH